MFYYLCGKLAYSENGVAVIDCGGVGYKLTISTTTYQALPSIHSKNEQTVKLYTYLAVREDDVELFGFSTQTELNTFKLLITVSGVGPKAAISILSAMTPEKFAIAVCTDDKKTIGTANGIGPKTAARIILELKDKLMKESGKEFEKLTSTAVPSGKITARTAVSEAIDALVVLGYSRSEAMAALKDLDPTMELQEMIRLALKKLMRPGT
ncbi:MAG: Holliday junction branch migration protein RuvA [Ruminococcaceae bacterium]|nr:Holliday junction branch migration protein RuvA [Oscillospiraceae bacterium]